MPPNAQVSQSAAGARAASRLSNYSSREKRSTKTERDRASEIIPYLANREFHLPGNNLLQDYLQYFMNNHPVFGICCHNKLHPIGFKKRIIILIGSIAFGLAVTNFIVLYFFYNIDESSQRFFNISLAANITVGGQVDSEYDEVSISTGQIFLWTVGAALHSIFDLSVWYISACVCCLPGGQLECLSCCKVLGSYIVIFTTVVVVAVSSFIVVLRATIDSNENVMLTDLHSGGLVDDEIQLGEVDGIDSYAFVVSWFIEVATALFIWNPIFGTILFSGILGCYKLPFLGGRPRDMIVEEQQKLKRSATDISYGSP